MPDVSFSGQNNDELLFTDDQGFDSPHSSADEEYESDEPPALKLDLQKLKDCASKVASSRCVNARRLARGSYHEIFLLDFEPSSDTIVEIATARNSCIARLTRRYEPVAKATSELATMKYVKEHSSIPVAKVFYQDLCPDNQVGAPFVLMERLPGKHLYNLWGDLSLEHKKDVLTQIAHVLTRLATFRFDRIGSLQDYGVGPLLRPSLPGEDKSFSSTVEYLSAFFRADTVENPELKDIYHEVRQELKDYFSTKSDASYLNAPFRLIHGDFDGQNLLFTESPPESGKAPTLSGVLDFEYSYTGPLYYLYDYPVFIQDVDLAPELYEENAILRPHFVRALQNAFPRDSLEAKEVKNVMRGKDYLLNGFPRLIFSLSVTSKNTEFIVSVIRDFLKTLRDGTGLAYDGRIDYMADPEPDSDKD